jgi:hypothetical protein
MRSRSCRGTSQSCASQHRASCYRAISPRCRSRNSSSRSLDLGRTKLGLWATIVIAGRYHLHSHMFNPTNPSLISHTLSLCPYSLLARFIHSIGDLCRCQALLKWSAILFGASDFIELCQAHRHLW